MSHIGPNGLARESVPFTKSGWFTEDCVKKDCRGGKCKLLLLNYNEPGDILAWENLQQLAQQNPLVEVAKFDVAGGTKEAFQAFDRSEWSIVINESYCHIRGAAFCYDSTGGLTGARGGPGCTGFGEEILMNHHILFSSSVYHVKIHRNQSVTEFLNHTIAKGAYWDLPKKIYVVRPDFYDEGTEELIKTVRKQFEEPGLGIVRVVDFPSTLVVNQLTEDTTYVAIDTNKVRSHFDEVMASYKGYGVGALMDKLRGDRNSALMRTIWGDLDKYHQKLLIGCLSRSLSSNLKNDLLLPHQLEIFDKMFGTGATAGAVRGTLQILSAATPRCKMMTMDDGGFALLPNWGVNALPRAKRPKGPITMPGLGERKKKGKTRAKY
jgi:hypothetical protein